MGDDVVVRMRLPRYIHSEKVMREIQMRFCVTVTFNTLAVFNTLALLIVNAKEIKRYLKLRCSLSGHETLFTIHEHWNETAQQFGKRKVLYKRYLLGACSPVT